MQHSNRCQPADRTRAASSTPPQPVFVSSPLPLSSKEPLRPQVPTGLDMFAHRHGCAHLDQDWWCWEKRDQVYSFKGAR